MTTSQPLPPLRWAPDRVNEFHFPNPGPRALKPESIPEGALVMAADLPTADQWTLHRAITRQPNAPLILFEEPESKGQAWYDALPRVTGMAVYVRRGDAPSVKRELGPKAGACDRITLALTTDPGKGGGARGDLLSRVRVDMAFLCPDEAPNMCHGEQFGLVVDRNADLDASEVAEFVTSACFIESDDAPDGYKTQHDAFLTNAAHHAASVLGATELEADVQRITTLMERHVLWAAPQGHAVRVILEDGRCVVEEAGPSVTPEPEDDHEGPAP